MKVHQLTNSLHKSNQEKLELQRRVKELEQRLQDSRVESTESVKRLEKVVDLVCLIIHVHGFNYYYIMYVFRKNKRFNSSITSYTRR